MLPDTVIQYYVCMYEYGVLHSEQVLLEKPCHSSELMSTLTALTPEVWLSVVKERLQQWTASMTPWK